MKLDADGNELWRRTSPAGPQGGSSTSVFATGIAVDSDGNCAVCGWFTVQPYSSTYVNFGSVLLSSNSKYSTAFTARYDPSGNLLWAKTFVPSSFESLNYANGVATDTPGGVYVTGNSPIPANPSADYLFLVKYDNSGNLTWSKQSSGTGGNSGQCVLATGNGEVFVVGKLGSQRAMGLDSFEFSTADAFLRPQNSFAPPLTGTT